MDARLLTGFVGPVLVIALLVNVVRWVAARPLDGLAGSARARSTPTSLVGALVVGGLVTGEWLDEAGVWFAAANERVGLDWRDAANSQPKGVDA
ncbi:hypothetical protein [Intrasporangium sp.]|uniref:hypothetical protein n=1 Tax=Intrasporangium sp. TaxID=1925024 RepID=UPI00293B4608|nr:hypothetical protein [Intrasporangium sp.]MDV3222673.1 hypothetical protein [Intrasporangium sp.]